ncbi:MAG: hypothetical protein GEU28_02955 [Dehalococcoidia bacterium]|nr:hypothetical protein [Dehalococcoidia bacterium]
MTIDSEAAQYWNNDDWATRELKPGVICASGSITVSGAGFSGNVTLVAQGAISVSGAGINLTSFLDVDGDALLMASFSMAGLDISGAGQSWVGILFASNGLAQASGAGAFSVEGGIIADRVAVVGSGMELGQGDGEGDTSIRLVE